MLHSSAQPELSNEPKLCAIVLAGGLSSRLGHDKAALHFDSMHTTDLLGSTVSLLEQFASQVYVIGRTHSPYPCIPDLMPGKGPVGGIASALHALCGAACLVLSCDMPFMDKDVLQRLLTMRNERPAGTLMTAYKQAETGHMEALVAVYEPGALPYFMDCMKKDWLKVSSVVPEELQYLIPYSAKDSLPFFNINYPADLELVRRMLTLISQNS